MSRTPIPPFAPPPSIHAPFTARSAPPPSICRTASPSRRNGATNPAADEGAHGEKTAVRKILAQVQPLAQQVSATPFDPTAQPAALATTASLSNNLRQLMGVCHQYISAAQNDADRSVRLTLALVSIIGGATLACAGLMSLSQYRGVVAPLHRMRQRVRSLAAGNFADRLPLEGDREFTALAEDFNSMAGELANFYQRLEQMVATKSRELVRSERLASVGFLAAGVAHEINNPLHIMSGYAELSMKRLKSGATPEVVGQVNTALNIIREEAFRCRDITEKLLSLSRQGGTRENISLAKIAGEVAEMVRCHKAYRDRQLILSLDHDDALEVCANIPELKQVLLNLTVNALEAVAPGAGKVCIEARRLPTGVELSIIDNGRGMPAETLQHVFEPFFTEKRGAGAAGTGLGLSITHAIVRDHGAQISAHSDGPGQGSRFVILFNSSKPAQQLQEAAS